MLPPLRSALLSGIPHAFSARDGLADDAVLTGGQIVRVRQVHSAQVMSAAQALARESEADALVTDRPGLVLTIVTADCAPVLLADRQAGVVGAAHAGWRGAFGGVLENTIAAMEAMGARSSRILAAIGPTIACRSYEVDTAFRERFQGDGSSFFRPGRPGHWQFDLPAYCRNRLRAAGVEQVDDLAEDTYSQPDLFHSFRRATHAGEATGGRQTSAIALSHR